ncbi:hypothetical protein GLOIN_2v1705208 [Rhizophagus irregularis DAOM 181602=DAOM 197198]|uniref:Uncharacterized protein n=1 Tax=Rhizophagus irregularis (strain DAOM 181602 / DAOM 197198 / MUCL 43194) TaxID=747089 RepID=A0A2P4P787_RHIID|nr:hypothetical protein GLOIN_2v1705208 [Rhizophagus irregularis DAOM 181602=DAOM 197198]POG61249.1 hypothetical protein GLOIN_2v1705208 [Rhizophagus irregularis DAOM 181602=DAOM 197198]|eukprot:XP_025168115.1 hypothetical protein GLOIN_2v1705208 [Rhizophagus irregularis DAOM 181602=DAOM 197198]
MFQFIMKWAMKIFLYIMIIFLYIIITVIMIIIRIILLYLYIALCINLIYYAFIIPVILWYFSGITKFTDPLAIIVIFVLFLIFILLFMVAIKIMCKVGKHIIPFIFSCGF